MKHYTLISCLTILTFSLIENSQADVVSQASRCRAAHKECESILNLYGIEPKECHAHVERHYGGRAVKEEIVAVPAPTVAAEIPTTTETVDTDFGGIQGFKGFRNAIEGD